MYKDKLKNTLIITGFLGLLILLPKRTQAEEKDKPQANLGNIKII